MKTYIIIPQFLVTEELVELSRNCIQSWKDFGKCDIISVDDSGEYEMPKGAQEVLEMSDYIVKMPENSGFARACNAGFKKAFELAGYEDCYIICSNNDIEVNKKTQQALIDPFEMFENVAITGIVSTKAKDWEGKPLDEMDWGQMTQDGLLRDRMADGGLWCSKKSILEKIAEYVKIQ